MLRAQASCEVYAKFVYEALADVRGGEKLWKLLEKPPSWALISDGAITTFYLLFGEWIDEQSDWWDAYSAHQSR